MAFVLVVDDDDGVRDGILALLESLDHRGSGARDGLEALRTVGTKPFEVALVDLFMPNMDGLELIPKLLVQAPDLKIVAMSGGYMDGRGMDLLRTAQAAGAVRTIEKPFSLHGLTDLLAEVLGDE